MAIQITIKGPQGCGKELLAQLLAIQLGGQGFKIRLAGQLKMNDLTRPQLVKRVQEVAAGDDRLRIGLEGASPDWSFGDEITKQQRPRGKK